jgi:AcrR family transcriptional regulator
MTTSSRGAGRPRLPQTDQKILDAARQILRARGPGALTVEAVAHASGVARTTIYRRYADRHDLLVAALSEVTAAPLPPLELPVAEKIRWCLQEAGALVESSIGRGGVAAVLTEADPELATALRHRVEARVSALRELVELDMREGRVAGEVDPDTLVGVLLGAYLGEVLRHGQPRDGWLERTARLVAGAVTAPADPSAAHHPDGRPATPRRPGS